jgi:hypothetical protein
VVSLESMYSVVDSEIEVLTLGPEETVMERQVNSIVSVLQCCRNLIAEADGTILKGSL